MKYLIYLLTLVLSTEIYAYSYVPWARGNFLDGKSSSGISGPKYSEIVQMMKNMEKRYPSLIEVNEYGLSSDNQKMYGMIIRDKKINPEKVIYISEATHGDEYLNLLDRMIPFFVSGEIHEFMDFYAKGGVFMLIPIFNPYGYTKKTRSNAQNQDLNRDYNNIVNGINRFKQPETRLSVNWLENFLIQNQVKLSLTMDYHCCYNGTLLQPWAFQEIPLSPPDRAKHDEIGELLKKQIPDTVYGPVTDILWYAPDGSSMDYYYAKFGSISLAFEGRMLYEANNLQKHVDWFREVVGYIELL